jgi:hypothetical protein
MKKGHKYKKPELKAYGSLKKLTEASGSVCPRDNPKIAGTRVC